MKRKRENRVGSADMGLNKELLRDFFGGARIYWGPQSFREVTGIGTTNICLGCVENKERFFVCFENYSCFEK